LLIKKLIKLIFFKLKYIFRNIYFSSNINKYIRGRFIFNKNKGFFFAYFKNSFFSSHNRPKYFSDIKSIKKDNLSNTDTCIILQGPIIDEDNFTLETIKIYLSYYKHSQIILSTWSDADLKPFKQLLRNKLFSIITSEIPLDKGYANVNLQIISTKKALDIIDKKKIKHVLKTRTDMRYYYNDIISYFKNLLIIFPLKKKFIQRNRIIVSSVATCKYRVYGLTDMLMFGDINDIKNYWDVALHRDGIKEFNSKDQIPVIKGTPIISEIYLCAMYLKKIKINLSWTLDHWWSLCGELFLVVDSTMLDWYWIKYEKEIEYKFTKSYSSSNSRCIDYSDWINLYNNKNHNWKTGMKQEKWGYNKKNILVRFQA